MSDDFRRRANEDVARLLDHWRTIEFWVKRAEQVNKKAVIPAINELRYASRQIFNAYLLLRKERLNEGEMSVVRRRIIIGEQYLFNAEHDIADAITGFYDQVIEELDAELGHSLITEYYAEYPQLRERVRKCLALIAEAREDYEKRGANYREMRDQHFPFFIDCYWRFLDAEVSARIRKQSMEDQLVIARATINIIGWIAVIGSIASILSLVVAIYFWTWANDSFCAVHGKRAVIGWLCPPSK